MSTNTLHLNELRMNDGIAQALKQLFEETYASQHEKYHVNKVIIDEIGMTDQ